MKSELQKFAERRTPFSGICYRCIEPQFADEIVSGVGSQLHGSRWTPRNSFPSVYLCETAEAALQEYLLRGRRLKLPDYNSLPMVMAGVTVKVLNLLDTTRSDVAAVMDPFLTEEKIHWRAIQHRREAVTQAFGRAIHEICFSGLIAPSHALLGARNIVIFPQKIGARELLSALRLKPQV